MAQDPQVSKQDINSLHLELSSDEIEKMDRLFNEAIEKEQGIEQSQKEKETHFDIENERLSNILIGRIENGGNIQEALREVIHSTVKSSYEDREVFSQQDIDPLEETTFKVIESKKNELYEILDNIDSHLAGKSTEEVAGFFSSLLDIESQLCLQKTEGVIAVKTRLNNFFPSLVKKGGNTLHQEITLIFTPEELKAMRIRFSDLRDDDPLKPFFTSVLDQAYDVVQYNEMTGNLLLEMSNYFLNKLSSCGYGNTTKAVEFKERHERARLSLQKSINELRDIEMVIEQHLKERSALVEFPKYLRALIQIKLGLLPSKYASKILQKIQANMGNYARARSAVAFDFNRLPSYQHGVRLRQSIIMNLLKDILEYTGELFEKEFRFLKHELKAMIDQIEAASEIMDSKSPEFEELLQKKALIQIKFEEQRRKLDVIKSQEKLVDVQHRICCDAIQKYNKQESLLKRVEEELNSRAKTIPDKINPAEPNPPKKPSRMVMAKRW